VYDSVLLNTGSHTNSLIAASEVIGGGGIFTNLSTSTIIGRNHRVNNSTNVFLLGQGLASTSNHVAKIGYPGAHLIIETNRLQSVSNGVTRDVNVAGSYATLSGGFGPSTVNAGTSICLPPGYWNTLFAGANTNIGNGMFTIPYDAEIKEFRFNHNNNSANDLSATNWFFAVATNGVVVPEASEWMALGESGATIFSRGSKTGLSTPIPAGTRISFLVVTTNSASAGSQSVNMSIAVRATQP
jgi:hypothetical protein